MSNIYDAVIPLWKQILGVVVSTLPIASGFFAHRALGNRGWGNASSALVTGGVVTGMSVGAYFVNRQLLLPTPEDLAKAAEEYAGLLGGSESVSGMYLSASGGMPRSTNTGRGLGLIDAVRTVSGIGFSQSVPQTIRRQW